MVGAWRRCGALAAGLGAQTVLTCAAWTQGSRLGGDGPARRARAARIDRGSAVRRPSGLHLSHHLASTSMVVRIACPGLPAANNDAAALCRVATAQDCWSVSVSVAGGPIMASRLLASSSCRFAISAIVGSPVTQVFSTWPCFVPTPPINTDSSAVGWRRAVPTV